MQMEIKVIKQLFVLTVHLYAPSLQTAEGIIRNVKVAPRLRSASKISEIIKFKVIW